MQYLAWAHIALEYQDTFWTSKEVRDMIKDHFSVVVNRRNMFTGKLYKEDDTIFAWDIYNVRMLHPTCLLCSGQSHRSSDVHFMHVHVNYHPCT